MTEEVIRGKLNEDQHERYKWQWQQSICTSNMCQSRGHHKTRTVSAAIIYGTGNGEEDNNEENHSNSLISLKYVYFQSIH